MVIKNKKILILGATGKMGCALQQAFGAEYDLVCKSSTDFDAADFSQVRDLINETNPDIVINAVAMLGIDHCEKEPEKAMQLNGLYPKLLAELSCIKKYLLIHFSTDAVFDGRKHDFYHEDDIAAPLNIYGKSKLMGDDFVRTIADTFYLIRVSVLFGESVKKNQFVEKMLARIADGATVLRIADDIVLSPTYALDVAWEIKRIIEEELPFGLYHVANQGKASLYELMVEVAAGLGLTVELERGSHHDFPAIGTKNTHTPLASQNITNLRPWRDAVRAYCARVSKGASRG